MPFQLRYALRTSDAVSWLRALPNASVDLVVTDAAYVSLEKHRAVGIMIRL
jgi:site-specific DNA-methyltransferase (adenine-specific)